MDEICVACGAYVPEGRMICTCCEARAGRKGQMTNQNIDLRERRRALGLTQEEMAAALGVSQISLSAWETGRAWPSLDRLPAMAETYGIGLEQLVRSLIVLKRRAAS